MKVELSIADDRELRAHIKDCIKGEVVSIARGEIRAILAEVVKEGILPKTQAEMDAIVKQEIVSVIREALGMRSSWLGDSTLLKQVVREEMSKLLKEAISWGNVAT